MVRRRGNKLPKKEEKNAVGSQTAPTSSAAINKEHETAVANDTMSTSTKSSKTDKKKKRSPPPVLGHPSYKSATQLRNARKRRKLKNEKANHQQKLLKQQQRKEAKAAGSPLPPSSSLSTQPVIVQDPSLKYLSDPKSAPIIQKMIKFFEEEQQQQEVQGGTKFRFDGVFLISPKEGWRTVTKLAAREKSPQHGDRCVTIGMFMPGSHDIVPVSNSKVHHPSINTAIQAIQKKCRSLGIQPYNETEGKGSLRHIAINVERATGNQQVTLVWNDDDNVDKEEQKHKLNDLCQELQKVSDNKGDKRLTLHSLWIHKNNAWKHANSIFDREGNWELILGQQYLIEKLNFDTQKKDDDETKVVSESNEDEELQKTPVPPEVSLHFPPQVFRQANIDAFTFIIARIRSWLFENKPNPKKSYYSKHCVELYGGVGTIGLHLVDMISKSLVCSDENPFNQKCFELAQKKLESDCNNGDFKQQQKIVNSIRYESKSATQMVEHNQLDNADLIIVDPPRKGLDDVVLDGLCANSTGSSDIQTLVYVSCGFDAFMKDYECLTTKGNWVLQHAEGHILFPGSDAIETLAIFVKK